MIPHRILTAGGILSSAEFTLLHFENQLSLRLDSSLRQTSALLALLPGYRPAEVMMFGVIHMNLLEILGVRPPSVRQIFRTAII